MTRSEVLAWLREDRPERLAVLWRQADEARRSTVGADVHLRGLLEISNHCVRGCLYCGISTCNPTVDRYRMRPDEIVEVARRARDLGLGTVVLQSGDDPALTGDAVSALVRAVKRATGLAVTLSLGERSADDLAAWRSAGADRYLLRFETSDADLFRRIHPGGGSRIGTLRILRELGYEVGSGVMTGIPGQSIASLADDLLLFRELDLDMIGIGPYIAHPATPAGRGELAALPRGDQAPDDEATTLKMVALARLLCPEANIPATTALATVDRTAGRELGLARGANVVMPNLTPQVYRRRYEIYPDKAGETDVDGLLSYLARIGRPPGTGPGGRRRAGGTAHPPGRGAAPSGEA